MGDLYCFSLMLITTLKTRTSFLFFGFEKLINKIFLTEYYEKNFYLFCYGFGPKSKHTQKDEDCFSMCGVMSIMISSATTDPVHTMPGKSKKIDQMFSVHTLHEKFDNA